MRFIYFFMARIMETKLTPKLQKKIIKYIEGGSYTVVACNAVGIDRQTLWQWIQKGERAIKLEKEGKKISKKQENYRNLNNGIKKARAEAPLKAERKAKALKRKKQAAKVLKRIAKATKGLRKSMKKLPFRVKY